MTDKTRSVDDLPRSLSWIVAMFLITGVVFVAVYFHVFHGSLSTKQEVWGQFGEYVGGILGPLFALAALFALLYTVILQSKELRASAEQLEKSQRALESQNSVLERQNFESTFFQLLHLYNEIVLNLHIEKNDPSGLTLSADNREYRGRECFQRLQHILLQEHLKKVNRGDYVSARLAGC